MCPLVGRRNMAQASPDFYQAYAFADPVGPMVYQVVFFVNSLPITPTQVSAANRVPRRHPSETSSRPEWFSIHLPSPLATVAEY